jgi:hypothetical protein
MFAGRKLCIATMHKKEQVIAPILERELGVSCFTSEGLNTDLLGTFSGEVPRTGTPIETARQKCLRAMAITGCDLAVSSEGSFGPHPAYGFIPADEELLLLCDTKNTLEIVVKELSTQTNFSGDTFMDAEALREFAHQCQFPSHALIIKDADDGIVEKGINDWAKLDAAFNRAKARGAVVKAETDMRAHLNPTRMTVIEKCAEKLAAAARTCCPACGLPGFAVTTAEPGLPCELCGMPTRSSLKHVKICKRCGHPEEHMYPQHKQFEEPTFCDFCNP